MLNTDFFELLFTHLEKCSVNNIREQLETDTAYQDTLTAECECYQRYDLLDLTEEQNKVIEQWIDAIQTRNAAYSRVVFRMGMQCCFSLMVQLVDFK